MNIFGRKSQVDIPYRFKVNRRVASFCLLILILMYSSFFTMVANTLYKEYKIYSNPSITSRAISFSSHSHRSNKLSIRDIMSKEFLILVSLIKAVTIVTAGLLIASTKPLIKVKDGTLKLRRSPYSNAFYVRPTDVRKVITRNNFLIVIRNEYRPIQLPVKNFSHHELEEAVEFFRSFLNPGSPSQAHHG